ncbi:MAG: hypothetical protein M3081_07610 [Gemmatimonadota bacterium]|nr:hypothetical protein [Gemmatimonadota bacterium]
MANKADRAYGLTVMSPITPGMTADGITHDLAIRRELLALDSLYESPFADVPTTHLARWVVIDTLPYEGIPAIVDQLAYKYLLFTSNFDGELDDYLELMRTRMPDAITRVWSHCLAFPGVSNAAAFANYIKRCQVETSFFFGAYTKYTLDDVLRALDTQQKMAVFVAEHQEKRSAPAELQRAFRDLVSTLATAPTPRPGTL